MSEGERVEDFLLGRSQEEGPAESAPTPTKTQATRTQYKEGGEKDSATDDGSVLAQVQKYQLRHQVTAAEGSDSEFDSDSDDEEDYQVFGRMTIKAQSEAFYQVRMQQKENKSANKSNSAKVLPKFLMKKKTQTLQPLKESNER